jgi:flagellar biosynthesis protein FlhA
MPPATAQQIVQQISNKVMELTQAGRTAVILCAPNVRAAIRKMIEVSVPHVAVLSYNEIVPEVSVEAVGLVGMNG